ncbi:LysR family transcriptional regulator [Serratia sp. IR-2025]
MEEPSLYLVKAFVAVAESQSFAKAALSLNMTPSSVSRLIKKLEQQLGMVLINRTTRTMALTETGQRYFADCNAALEQLRFAYERVRDGQNQPQGTLRISASMTFGREHIAPYLSAFMEQFPQLRLDLIMTDRYVDIIAERVGVAIRIGRLQDSSLLARKLLDNRRILVASPAYLQRWGTPTTLEELQQHQCLVSTASHDGRLWRLFGPEGEIVFHPKGRMQADNGDAVKQFCLDGQGIAFHSSVTMEGSIRRGELVPLLTHWTGRETGVYAVYPPGTIGPAARALVDFLCQKWRESP